MSAIKKLRQRLGNVKKGVTEYRMTVDEAKLLIAEFKVLEDTISELSKPKVIDVVPEVQRTITNILDGGHF